MSAAVTTAADIYSLGRVLAALIPERDADLDAVVARATAGDPARRYSTVDALAQDVAAWRSGMPVAARGGGRRYVAAKFLRRHAWAAGAAGAALTLLVGALILTAAAWRDAEAARVAEGRRFAEVRGLAGYLLFDLNNRLRRIPGNTAARADLVKRAQVYLDGLAGSASDRRDVQVEAVRGFIRLAEILGSPLDRNLGDVAGAGVQLGRARALIRRVRDAHGDASDLNVEDARIDAAGAMIAFHQEGDAGAARRLLGRAQGALDAVPLADRDADWHGTQREVGRSRVEFLMVNEEMAAVPVAAARHRRAVAAWPATMARGDAAAIEHAFADYHEGAALTFTPRENEAFALLARAARRFVAAGGRRPDDPDLLYWIGWSGSEAFGAAARLGRAAQAARLLAAARAAAGRLVAVTDGDRSARPLWRSVNEVHAGYLAETGRAAEALAIQRDLIASRRQANGADPEGMHAANLAYSEMMLGTIARHAGDRALACRSWGDARRHFSRAARDGALIGFHAAFLPGLDRQLAACAAGRPLSAMGALR